MTDPPRLSIIVPAQNAQDFLPRCLEALDGAREGIASEVLVVDDASTDDTAEFAESRGVEVLRLERGRGPSAARNRGAARARGATLMFVDADVVVHPDALSRVLELLDRHPEVSAVFGSYDRDPAARGAVTRYKNLLHHFVHQHARSEAFTFWTGCGAIRRSAFEEMGGFDEEDYPFCIEDIELGYRLRRAGHALRLDREIQCTHLKRWTLLSLIRTDVCCRAVPWARLNRIHGVSPDDLNIKPSQKLSVALTMLALALIALGPLWPGCLLAAGLLLLAVLALNAGLFRFFAGVGGWAFALQCAPLHLLYFAYSGLSYLLCEAAWRLGLRLPDGNRRSR